MSAPADNQDEAIPASKRIRAAAWCLLVVVLLALAIHQKILPSEQRALRAQLREAIALVEARQPYRPPALSPASSGPMDPIALRRALSRGELNTVMQPFARTLAEYETFALGEAALRPYLATFELPHEPAMRAFDAHVDAKPSAATYLARGIQRARLGWQARGGDYATRTPAHKLEAMTRWHALAAADLVQYLRLSQRPTPAVIELLGLARAYDHAALAEALFEVTLRADGASPALFDEYLVHFDAAWGRKSVNDNRDLAARARALGLASGRIDQTERILDYMQSSPGAYLRTSDAVSRAEHYSASHETYDAWLWRARVEQANNKPDAALLSCERAAGLQPEALEPAELRAHLLEIRGRHDEARAEYQRLMERGSDYAQNRIIQARIWGELGYTRDWPAIRMLCEASADMLNRAGEFCIGGLYFDGLAGYPRDSAQAVRWFRRAAERHHARAQHDFGWMLVKGMGGVEKDHAEGVYWLRQSAQNGFAMAGDKLKQLGESSEPWSHTWWRIESELKRTIAPGLWWLVDRLPAQ